MRILMPTYEFPPLGGGAKHAIYGLATELARHEHVVDLVTMSYRELPRSERVEGVNVYRVPCIRLREHLCSPPEMVTYLCTALPFLRKLVRTNRYDINHTHFIFPDGFLSYCLWKTCGLPYVITSHGSDVPGYNPNRFRLLHRLLRPLWHRIVAEAQQVILPSASLRDLFIEYGPRDKAAVIPYGVTLDHFDPGVAKRKRILVVTRMFERKGVQYFLRALGEGDLGHEVHIVGDGPYLPRLREVAEEVGARVRFWGWLPSDAPQLKELYETSAILVFTSERENLPLVLFEGMAAGMAIITTEGTGCAEVVGEAAILVKPRDPHAIRQALELLVANPQMCRELGQRARQRLAANFAWPAIARRHNELYDTVRQRRQSP